MAARIADALEGTAPGVVVTTKPRDFELRMPSSAWYRLTHGVDEAGESFVLQISSETGDVIADAELVLRRWAARHPLSMRYKLFAEW
jgi:hypothetical protein